MVTYAPDSNATQERPVNTAGPDTYNKAAGRSKSSERPPEPGSQSTLRRTGSRVATQIEPTI